MADAEADDDPPPSWWDILAGDFGPSLVLVCLGVWLHAADSLLVATILPAIISEIGGAALVSWTILLYELGSIVAGAAAGLLAIRHGIRAPMAVAAVVFASGCAFSAVAGSMPIVLAGRLLQGLGGGGLMAMSFIAVRLLFPRRLIARAMAAVATLWGVSSFLGPLIGGLFVEYASWRAAFWAFGGQAILLAAWIATGRGLDAGRSSGAETAFPVGRLLILALGVMLVAYGGIDIAPLRTGSLVLCGLLCIAAFLFLDARSGSGRLLPPRPFSLSSSHGASLMMVFSFSAGTIAVTAYGPILVTVLHGASALTAGYIVACSAVAWTLTSVIVSGRPERHDPAFIAIGMVVVAASILGLIWSVPTGPIWLIAVFAAMEGAGFGMAWTFILRRATELAPVTERERISGALPTVQRLGYAFGAAYIGIIANAAGFSSAETTEDVAYAARWIFIGCLLPAGFGLIALSRFVRRGSFDLVGAPPET